MNIKNKNRIVLLLIVLIAITVVSLVLIKRNTKEVIFFNNEGSSTPLNLINDGSSSAEEDVLVEDNKKENFVILEVLNESYEIGIKNNDSVYDAMNRLSVLNKNDFSFEYENYQSMGIFIKEINGRKEKSGAYWIYSINGEEASVGVSKYILKSGDVITWEQK